MTSDILFFLCKRSVLPNDITIVISYSTTNLPNDPIYLPQSRWIEFMEREHTLSEIRRRVITHCAITSKYNRIVTYDSVTSALGISYNTRRQRRSLWRCYRLSLFTRQSRHDPWNGPARLRLIPGFLDTMTIVRCSLFRSRTDRPRARALIPSDYPLIRTRNWNAPAAILFIMSPCTCNAFSFVGRWTCFIICNRSGVKFFAKWVNGSEGRVRKREKL